jgi:hypothetical protein
MSKALGQEMRRNLRRKFRAAEKASAIEMTVVDDVAPIINDIYPLYLNVYERSKLQFESLTERYFCGLGRLMPEKARFFVWRQGKTIVAFMSCLIEGDELCAEYIGLGIPGRARSAPLFLFVPRRRVMGHRQRLQMVSQQRSELRSEIPPQAFAGSP